MVIALLSPLMAMSQEVSAAKEQPRKDQVQEIERYLRTVDGEDRSTSYVAYVVVGTLGVMGCMVLVRRLLL